MVPGTLDPPLIDEEIARRLPELGPELAITIIDLWVERMVHTARYGAELADNGEAQAAVAQFEEAERASRVMGALALERAWSRSIDEVGRGETPGVDAVIDVAVQTAAALRGMSTDENRPS